MSLHVRHFGWSALLLITACERPSDRQSESERVASYSAPVALLVRPDSQEIERLRRQLGDEAFYVTADDMMWYRAAAVELLDSLRVPHAEVARGEARFLVRGQHKLYSWRDVDGAWFLVLYDGLNEPRTSASVDLPQNIHYVTRSAR